jgi:aminoacylase
LDEGLANEGNAYSVFYGERTVKWIIVKAEGNIGHGSQFIKKTAIEKLINVINAAYDFRKEQENALNYHGDGCKHA